MKTSLTDIVFLLNVLKYCHGLSSWTLETSRSHLSAGSAEGRPPGVALLRGGGILVHVFLQQTAAPLAISR